MNWSKETLKLAEMCWNGDQIRSTSVRIGETYFDKEGNKYKIRQNTYDELVRYAEVAAKKFKIQRFGMVINLMGVKD